MSTQQPDWVPSYATELMEWWLENGKPGRPSVMEELKRRTGRHWSQYKAMRIIDFMRGDPSDWQGRNSKSQHVPSASRGPVSASHEGDDQVVISVDKSPNQVTCLEDLIEASGLNPHEWNIDKHVVNRWESANGQGEVTPLWQVKAWLSKRLVERLQPAPRLKMPPRRKAPKERDFELCIILPDTQTGFTWGPGHRELIPYHDRVALDVARQVVEDLDPDEVIWLGDNLDFEELSTKFTRDPLAAQTTQPAIDEQAYWYRLFKASAHRARHRVFDGNHEARMKRALQEKSPWAVHLKAPGSERPLLSVPYLLGLDDIGIEWLGEYGSEFWLWDEVRISHGTVVASGGGRTSSRVVAGSSYSEVFGHIHSTEMASKTVWGPKGRRLISAMSPGCLCRVDGAVPGVSSRPDWQQGFGVITRHRETGATTMHPVQIHDGIAMYGGKTYSGVDRTAEIADALGYPQMAVT